MTSGLAVAAVVVGAGPCRREPVPIAPVRLVNRPPVIQAVVLTSAGRRLRHAHRGLDLEVRVIARDPDGDRLRYQWVASPDSSHVVVTGAATARWSVPGDQPSAVLQIRVVDPHGRTAQRLIRPTDNPRLTFGGQVVDADGHAISRVNVTTDGVSARTDERGRFSLAVPDSGQDRFVFNLDHPDFGPVSQVVSEAVTAGRWVMAKASVARVDFQQAVNARVSNPSCAATLSSRASWASFPRQHTGVNVHEGRAFLSANPPELISALQWAESPTSCPTGFSISLGPNALVRPGSNAPVAVGQLALTQIPPTGGGSMPGDYTVQSADGRRRVMWSYGAGSIRASSDGEPLQLAKGQHATIRWPVDAGLAASRTRVPSELPLLRYDESTGTWQEIGTARLDKSGTAWSAQVDHLTAFNLDALKVDQACVRVDAGLVSDPVISLEVTIPQTPFPVVRTKELDNVTTTLHVLYNLPSNTWIALRPFRDGGGTPIPLGTFIVNTGGPQQPTDPNLPAYPYDACQGEVELRDLGAPVSIANRDGDSQSGPLVPVYVGLVNPTSGDLYPAGAGSGFPVVGIFDNGSNSVFVTGDPGANRFTGSTTSDAERLGVTNGQGVTFRVTPVDLAGSPATAPMGPPGTPGGASAELASVYIRSGTGKNLSLAGAPFATTHIAFVDYARGVAIPGSTEMGAWSRYFLTRGSPGFPQEDIALSMVRFGSGGIAPSGYTRGERFLLRGVTFYHQGNKRGEAVAGSTDQMFYDTGTTWTAISTAFAAALGLNDDPDVIGDCLTAGRLFRVDSVAFVGTGGRYVMSNAMVCRDDQSMAQVGGGSPPDYSEVIIGSNLFRGVALVVDGPGNTLGILRP